MIRKDLWAVMVFENLGEEDAWVYHRIFRSSAVANQFKKELRADHTRSFPMVAPKVVHPPQKIVDYFVAMGNTID
jgi:hypothetical protein